MVDRVRNPSNWRYTSNVTNNLYFQNFEATGGDIIDQIKIASRISFGYKPNVVLINAGTNDANTNRQVGAGDRMETMIKEMWSADGMVSFRLRRTHNSLSNMGLNVYLKDTLLYLQPVAISTSLTL